MVTSGDEDGMKNDKMLIIDIKKESDDSLQFEPVDTFHLEEHLERHSNHIWGAGDDEDYTYGDRGGNKCNDGDDGDYTYGDRGDNKCNDGDDGDYMCVDVSIKQEPLDYSLYSIKNNNNNNDNYNSNKTRIVIMIMMIKIMMHTVIT